ncbi:conserved hypothetical protein [Methanococcus vannielii SB]|jgi:hypothetical protein|uniref:DUF4868 domain-containing protein n=1 Tax=Methanococcus vannielii (strain ATCC 35089 / DSM 1224 / JCM 13029 / OCM 148 / SB) TaxID=406327 RepID=A6UQY6_METVS|nr:hypothetical protein [Methanococcus vannielii]ABR54908.1 conserved hypothetical protein [Methanococcus vannielii SB]
MEKIYSKKGGILELKELIAILHDFTGIIYLNDAKLFYINSKLVFSSYNRRKIDLKGLLNELSDNFHIEVFKSGYNELNKVLDSEISNCTAENVKTRIEMDEEVFVDIYNNIEKYAGQGLFKISLIPRKYKEEQGLIIFSNKDEILAIYFKKDKILQGLKALNKIKTTFAVSDVKLVSEKISKNDFNRILKEYSESLLKHFVSYEELMETVKSRAPKIVKNDSLHNVFSKGPVIIEIVEKNAFIVSKDEVPVMAFLEEYEGDKAFRMIKNFCILNNTEFKIYEITENEFKMLKEFKNAKIKEIY